MSITKGGRRRSAAVAGLAAVAAVCVVTAFTTGATAAGNAKPTGSAKCTNGVVDRIGRRTVCIHVGGKCVAAHERTYRKRGYTCMKGRLRRYVATPPAPIPPPAPTPPPAPPAPPPPPATPGHWVGKTSQLEDIQFDVNPSGNGITGFDIHTVNESCSPAGSVYGGVGLTGTIPVAADGTFSANVPIADTFDDGTALTGNFTLRGAFSGATATGSFTLTHSFAYQGTPVSCTSGLASFTVTRSG
jgi:hypothetical protein